MLDKNKNNFVEEKIKIEPYEDKGNQVIGTASYSIRLFVQYVNHTIPLIRESTITNGTPSTFELLKKHLDVYDEVWRALV
jgi:hypothetical protein